jgi:hypothetical protein
VLLTQSHRITTAQAGVEQHIKPYPLSGPDRPSLLICGDVIFGPRADASIAPAGGSLDASGRIGAYKLHLERPPKQRSHRVQKVLRLPRRMRSALQASTDSVWRYG